MSDTKYFNFPIQLLEEIFRRKESVLSDVLNFALYSHTLKLNDENMYNNSEYLKFVAAAKWYYVDNITKSDFERGKKLFNSIPTDSPKVGLNIAIFWDFYKNEKSDFDIACLSAFLAIKSILGMKPYCKMNNSFLLARMSGKAKAIKDQSELPPEFLKYASEYQTVKIKKVLSESWGLITYSRYTRGFFVSFTLDYPALVMEAEKRRKSTKEKQQQQYKKDVLKQVLEKLNKPLSSPL